MGVVLAKLDQERAEFNRSRARAAAFLEKCRPEYIQDDAALGLAPEEDGAEEEEIEVEELVDAAEDGDEDDPLELLQRNQEGNEDPRSRAKMKLVEGHKKFFQAAASGSLLRTLLYSRKMGIRVDHTDKQGRTALYMAAERGHARIVDLLLGLHAGVNVANKLGWTPLHAATFHGHLACIEMLMSAGADVNASDEYGCTPLILAASSPKLYLIDLVSKKDRQRRQLVRINAFRKQLQGDKTKEDWIEQADPESVWTYYPNRVELIVMDRLLSTGKAKVDAMDKRRRTALMYAARYGRLFAVSRLLEAKANLRLSDIDGRTPVFHASGNAHTETVELLLRAKASVNSTDQFFRTPLHSALDSGDERMVNMLLKAEASVNAYDCEGRTPIMLAMDRNNRRLFAKIMERKANPDVMDKRGWNVVIYAVETGMLLEVKPILTKLAEKGAVQMILRARDPHGKNTLHHAAALPTVTAAGQAVRMLSELDPEAASIGDCNGDTAIHVAASLGRIEVLRGLIERMPSADFLNNRGETPLHHAAHAGHLACVVALIQDRGNGPACGAGAVDAEGKNLLMHACVSGNLDLVNLLLSNREGRQDELSLPPLDVNQCDLDAVNPISIAAREGHWHLLPSLMLAGVNWAAKDKDGFTAVHWAACEDEPLAVRSLLDLKLDADARDARGWTPLMHAAAQGCDEVVSVLVDAGADLDARNWDGDTAMQLCVRRKDDPEKVAVTKDILTDAILDKPPAWKGIEAPGHFMVSVLNAQDLYLEGSFGVINAYVCLQLCTQANTTPQVAYTSCTMQEPSPEWHEVFRFDTEVLDPTAVLVAWVIAAPGDTPVDVLRGTLLNLDANELHELNKQANTENEKPAKLQFTTAVQETFNKLTRRADRDEDKEIRRLRRLALAQMQGTEAPMDLQDAGEGDALGRLALNERRWTEVDNLREILKASGCKVPEPIAPRSHLPLGCVVARFRHLRAAVWSPEPIAVTRTLRLNGRGSLSIEIDFRPRYFVSRSKLPQNQDKEELTVLTLDASTTALELESAPIRREAADEFLNVKEQRAARNLERAMEAANKDHHLRDPEAVFRRFMQVALWSRRVIEAREVLGPGWKPGIEARAVQVVQAAASRGASEEDEEEEQDDPNPVIRAFKRLVKKYKAAREIWQLQQQILDNPMGEEIATGKLPSKAPKQGTEEASTAAKAPAAMRLPTLKVQPWLEDILDGSRFL